jgi:hypothetical protein
MAGRRRVSLGISDTIKLDVGPCDAIGIAVNEPGTQSALAGAPGVAPAPWALDVYAWTEAARVWVGRIDCVPDPSGQVLERLVGHAVCPGALEWAVEVTGPSVAQANAAAIAAGTLGSWEWWAELHGFSVAISNPGTGTGVFTPRGRVRTLSPAAGLAVSSVVTAFPARFRGFFGSNEGAAQKWLMLFDAVAVPANGTQPIAGIAIDAGAGISFNLSFADTLTMQTGTTWAVSDTANTLTLSATTFRVTTRLEF